MMKTISLRYTIGVLICLVLPNLYGQEKFDEKLAILLDDMYDTMQKANGVGLAAPQIGISKKIVVIDDDADMPPKEIADDVATYKKQLPSKEAAFYFFIRFFKNYFSSLFTTIERITPSVML